MAQHKDNLILEKIKTMKGMGLGTAEIARELNLHPETIRRYVRSKEFQSIAHEMAATNSSELQKLFEMSMGVAKKVIEEKDENGNPTKRASEMAKTLLNTQVGRLLGTKANEVEEDEDPKEKADLIKQLKELSRGEDCLN